MVINLIHNLKMEVMEVYKVGWLLLSLLVLLSPLLLQLSLLTLLSRKSGKAEKKRDKLINRKILSPLKILNITLKKKILSSGEKANLIKKQRIDSSKKPKLMKYAKKNENVQKSIYLLIWSFILLLLLHSFFKFIS